VCGKISRREAAGTKVANMVNNKNQQAQAQDFAIQGGALELVCVLASGEKTPLFL